VPLPPREHHNRCSTPTLNPSHRRPLLGPRARSSRSGCSSAPRRRRGDPPPLVASRVPCCRSTLLMWSRGRARRRWKDLPHIQGKEPLDSSPPPPLRWFPQMPKGWLHGGRPPGPSLQEAAFTGLFWPPSGHTMPQLYGGGSAPPTRGYLPSGVSPHPVLRAVAMILVEEEGKQVGMALTPRRVARRPPTPEGPPSVIRFPPRRRFQLCWGLQAGGPGLRQGSFPVLRRWTSWRSVCL
jgi:hypothetical protein